MVSHNQMVSAIFWWRFTIRMCWFLWDPTMIPARYIHREASVLREKEMHLGWIGELGFLHWVYWLILNINTVLICSNWRTGEMALPQILRFWNGEASNDAQFWPVHFPQTVCEEPCSWNIKSSLMLSLNFEANWSLQLTRILPLICSIPRS